MNHFGPNLRATEPNYKGKPLSEIICCGLPDDQYDAFTQLGTNSLPVVLDIIGATDKKMKWVAMSLKRKEFREKAFSGDEGTIADMREFASRAFCMLGTNANGFLEDKDPNVRYFATGALAGRDPDMAIPLLMPVLDDPDMDGKAAAAAALGSYGAKVKNALPKLVSVFTQTALRPACRLIIAERSLEPSKQLFIQLQRWFGA